MNQSTAHVQVGKPSKTILPSTGNIDFHSVETDLYFNRRGSTLFALVALAGAGASTALAQQTSNDAKCFLVSNMFAKSATDERAKSAAGKASYFYLGRLTGSSTQIEASLIAEARTVTPENAGATMQECARAVSERATQLAAIGQRLKPAERK